MNPDNSQDAQANPNMQKLEEDLKNLSQEAVQTANSPQTTDYSKQEAVVSSPSAVVSPSLETPPVPVKKSSSILMIAIALMLISAVSVGAYFLIPKYFGASSTPKACTAEAKLCPDGSSVGRTGPNCEFTACPEVTATPDPTADWKTYTDTKNSFSFRYPDNLTPIGKGVIGFVDSQNKTKFNFSGFELQSPSQYQIYLQNRMKNGGFVDQKTFTDSQDRSWKTDMILGEVFNFTGILNQLDKYYIVSLQSGLGEETDSGASFRNFANQILSTFKFTVATPSASPLSTPVSTTSANPFGL